MTCGQGIVGDFCMVRGIYVWSGKSRQFLFGQGKVSFFCTVGEFMFGPGKVDDVCLVRRIYVWSENLIPL